MSEDNLRNMMEDNGILISDAGEVLAMNGNVDISVAATSVAAEVADLVVVKRIIEGLLLASSDPVSIDYLHKLLSGNEIILTKSEIRGVLDSLATDYASQGRALELKEVAGGYRAQVRQDLAGWVNKLWEEKPPRYSRALLETLAIIAYKQPITRAEIEKVRGVSVSSNIIKTLLEHGWIKIVGYKEVPGRPAIHATTTQFLDHFNLRSLEELPAVEVEFEAPLPVESLPVDMLLQPEKVVESLSDDGEN